MKPVIFSAAILILSIAVAGSVSGADLWTVEDFTTTTSDGLELAGWLYVPTDEGPAPLVVCLPMLAHTHSTYRPFIDSLERRLREDSAARAPFILALDLRGHGESTRLGDGTISFQDMGPKEWARAPRDVVETIGRLLADSRFRVENENITVIGASIGANAAVMAAVHIQGAKKVVMLSPGLNYRDLQPADAIKTLQGRCLMYAAREDSYSAKSTRNFGEMNDACTVRIFDGALHGTDLVNDLPRAMTGILDFVLEE